MKRSPVCSLRSALLLLLFGVVVPRGARAQAAAARTDLDALVQRALAADQSIQASQLRVDAARHRIGPAGAWPDPMLTAGIVNLPVRNETMGASGPGATTAASTRDPMTMQMVGLSLTFPYPGKLSLATQAARGEVDAAEAELRAARLTVAAQVKREYYALAYIDAAMNVIRRTRGVIAGLMTSAEARYAAGGGQQTDVLSPRVEGALLARQAADLEEERRTGSARLDALLNRSEGDAGVSATFPASIVRAAVADSAPAVRFVSAVLGARASDSPLLPLDSLRALAVAHNPMLRARAARIAVQATRVALARKAVYPDVGLMLSYGRRPGFVDMVSATVSLPIPVQRAHKQGADIAAGAADLAALEAEQRDAVNQLTAEVVRDVSDAERARTQMALAVRGVLPQARAAVAAALSGYQVGRVEFAAVMNAQGTLFSAETGYYRSLTDFATALAELERTVGTGVLR